MTDQTPQQPHRPDDPDRTARPTPVPPVVAEPPATAHRRSGKRTALTWVGGALAVLVVFGGGVVTGHAIGDGHDGGGPRGAAAAHGRDGERGPHPEGRERHAPRDDESTTPRDEESTAPRDDDTTAPRDDDTTEPRDESATPAPTGAA